MRTIRADCTIVDLLVRNSTGRLAPDPSGWTSDNVAARINDANAVWAQAGIRFAMGPVGYSPFMCDDQSAEVDPGRTYFMVANHVHGSSFQRGRVSLAFIKRFSVSTLAGQSAEANAFTALAFPVYPSQSRWTLAHELGHLLGLPDESASGTIMYGGLPNSGRLRADQITDALRSRHLA